MRLAVASALALVLLPMTAGCGHGQGYCDKVTAHQSELGSIAGVATGRRCCRRCRSSRTSRARHPTTSPRTGTSW